jgi:hypothetical protein
MKIISNEKRRGSPQTMTFISKLFATLKTLLDRGAPINQVDKV